MHYPKDWDVLYNEPPTDTSEFAFSVSPPNAFHWIQVSARFTPKTEESTLYHYAGEVIETRQMGPYQTVWDKQLTSRTHLDWHLAIRGFSPFSGRYDGLGYIAQAGGLTEGTINAVHYDASRELAIQISKELDRDMLIALHESGPDAVYPALVPVFEEILQSVAVQNPSLPTANQVTTGDTPTAPPSPLASPLQTPPTQNPGWQTFSHHNGVALEYPAGWDVVRDGRPAESDEFFLMIRPPDGFHVQVIVTARVVPREEEPALSQHAGDVFFHRQFGDYKTVWDKQVTSRNNIDWHLTIRGFSLFSGRYDGLGYIVQAGGLTEGTIDAVHYDASRELAIQISKEFDRDMLIALHESGPDAVYPALAPVFEEILQSVTIVDQVAQITVPDAYTGTYHYRITYPTAAWRVEVVEELEGYESPRLKHLAIDGCLLYLRDGPRGTAPDAVVIEKQIAGLTWGVTRGGELYVFYALYQPDKGISFFIRLELPREASGEVKTACQDAAEAVINTFTLVE